MRISDFIGASGTVSTEQELVALLETAVSSMGFDRFAYGTLAGYEPRERPGLPAPAVALNYPNDWTSRYFERCYQRIDPVVLFTPQIIKPYKWDSLSARFRLTRDQRRFLDEAREAQLYDGLSVPLHGPFGRVAVLCFASSAPNKDSERHLGTLNAIAAQFQMVYDDKMADATAAQRMLPRLSQREVDCLSWAARGKSSWDISMILGISQNTVNYHMKNTMRKLDTNSRTVAIVKAIHLSLLRV